MKLRIPEERLGAAIEKRIEELKITKAEFGRRIGLPKQNVNRLLEKDGIETDKLVEISRALNFNFFALFCEEESGDTTLALGPGAKALSKSPVTITDPDYLVREVEHLTERLADKQEVIESLRAQLKAKGK